MKILQVISSFPPAFSHGGPVRVAFGISKELVKKGHKVTVYTTDVYDSNSRLNYQINPEIMDGIKVYRFRNISNKLSSRHLTCAPSMILSLKDKIKDFDIIHLHEYRSFQAILTHFYAKKYKIPYILQAHGAVLPFFEKQRIKKIFDYLWGDQILRDASKIIALTVVEAEQYRIMGVPKNKIEIIPNGLDLTQFSHLPEKGFFRSKYYIAENEKIILFLGRIHKIKGIDVLIDAYSDLINVNPKIKLVIVGPDENYLSIVKDKIKQLDLKNEPIFTGPLYNEDKLAAYVDADVYVLPSQYETFPMTVLEAWRCKVPVIITDRCGIANIIIENNAGIVVQYTKEQIVDAIMNLLNNFGLKEDCINNGEKLIFHIYNWEKIILSIENIYLKNMLNS